MGRIAAGIAIDLSSFARTGGPMRDAGGGELAAAAALHSARLSPVPVVNGPRSERVLSLVLTLEALRAAPAILDRPKV